MTVSGQPNLKELERRAWRSMHEDGLLDLFFGATLLILSVAALVEVEPWSIVVHLTLSVGLIVIFVLAKRWITVPRMGVAEFGPSRREKSKKTTVLLLFSALLGAALFVAIAIWGNFGGVNLFAGAWAFIVFGGMAYWLDLPRLLFAGLVYAVVFSHLLPVGTATTAFVGGMIIMLPALIMLIRFVRRYPLPTGAEAHDNG
jgi:hypothetical protein